MSPSLTDNDFVVVCKLCEYDYGDIVVFKGNEQKSVKRIIGKKGDQVTLTDNRVYKNGVNLGIPTEDMGDYLLGNEVFLIGDNYKNSYDSRNYGAVKKENIIGKVIFDF
jgi:signal peptidase I